MWPRPFLRERTYPLESPSNKLSLTLSSSLVNLFLLLLYFACAVFKDLWKIERSFWNALFMIFLAFTFYIKRTREREV